MPTSATVICPQLLDVRDQAPHEAGSGTSTRKPLSVDQSVSSNAFLAASMARSMSSLVPSAVTPSTSSVVGSMFSKVSPPRGVDQLPADQEPRLSIDVRMVGGCVTHWTSPA